MQVGRLRPALDDGVARQQPLAQGGQRQVDLGLREADVQIRARLDLDHGGLAVVEVGRRQPEARPVLVDDLRRGARAGEEPDIEVRELGHEGAAHDDPGRPTRDGVACHVEDVLAFDAEELVRRGPPALRSNTLRRPRGGEALAAQRPPDTARCDGHHHRQHGEEHDADGDRDEES